MAVEHQQAFEKIKKVLELEIAMLTKDLEKATSPVGHKAIKTAIDIRQSQLNKLKNKWEGGETLGYEFGE